MIRLKAQVPDLATVRSPFAPEGVEIARVCVCLADVRRPDDLELGEALGDFMLLRPITRVRPLARDRITIAKREEFEAHAALSRRVGFRQAPRCARP